MNIQAGASSSESTASSLLQRARSREETAWKNLVLLYGPLVYYWCRKSQLRPEDAADVVQEVFHGVALGLDNFERSGVGSFRGWLRAISRNKISDSIRRNSKQPQGPGGSSAHAAIHAFPDPVQMLTDDSLDERPPCNQLSQAVECLRSEIKDSTWQVFWRTTVEGHEPALVASELGMKLGAVYQAKSRALARLREILLEMEVAAAEKL